MFSFELEPEEKLLIETVREFVTRELMPYEEKLLRREVERPQVSAGLDPDERRDLELKGKSMGFWGFDTPEEYGGVNLSPLLQSLVIIELGRTFVGFSFGGEAFSVLYQCNDQQKDEYLLPVIAGDKHTCMAISEPGGGSDVRAMRTTAIRRGGDFVVNGEKMWISRALESDFAIVWAKTPEEGDGGITGFLIDRSMGWEASHIPTMGVPLERVATMSFSDVRVPRENVLGEINQGFGHLMGWIMRNRLTRVAPRLVGASERILSMGVEWGQQRHIFGKPLSDYSNWAFALANIDIEIRAAKLMILNGAWKASVGRDFRHEAYVAKVYCAQMANRTVDTILQMHGGMGYAKELSLERWYRDLRVGRIYEGSDEVNLAGIGRNLFKNNVAPGGVL